MISTSSMSAWWLGGCVVDVMAMARSPPGAGGGPRRGPLGPVGAARPVGGLKYGACPAGVTGSTSTRPRSRRRRTPGASQATAPPRPRSTIARAPSRWAPRSRRSSAAGRPLRARPSAGPRRGRPGAGPGSPAGRRREPPPGTGTGPPRPAAPPGAGGPRPRPPSGRSAPPRAGSRGRSAPARAAPPAGGGCGGGGGRDWWGPRASPGPGRGGPCGGPPAAAEEGTDQAQAGALGGREGGAGAHPAQGAGPPPAEEGQEHRLHLIVQGVPGGHGGGAGLPADVPQEGVAHLASRVLRGEAPGAGVGRGVGAPRGVGQPQAPGETGHPRPVRGAGRPPPAVVEVGDVAATARSAAVAPCRASSRKTESAPPETATTTRPAGAEEPSGDRPLHVPPGRPGTPSRAGDAGAGGTDTWLAPAPALSGR